MKDKTKEPLKNDEMRRVGLRENRRRIGNTLRIFSKETLADRVFQRFPKAFIALGTNDGNRESNIQTALEEIAQFAKITQKSSIYNTEPVGFKKQPDFLNMVIAIETELNPVELMIRLEEIEHKMGKNKEFENGPRLVDLDILFYDDKIVKYRHLEIPHPRLHQRNFVLTPLAEIAPKLIHPTLDKTIEYLKANLKSSEKIEKWI